MPGPVFLAGDRVSLHPIEEEDRDFLQQNANDPRVWGPSSIPAPINASQQADWLESIAEDENEIHVLVCVPGDGDDGSPESDSDPDRQRVGTVGLHGIDHRQGTADVGYWIAPAHQGNGYATAATDLLVGYAFDRLGLHKVGAEAFDFNAGSRRVLEKVGFREEGVRREDVYVGGERVDVHRYGLLAREYRDDG